MRWIPLSLIFLAAPASAAGIQVPEPSNLALFGMGLAGLIIGRRMAARKGGGDKD